jgi:cephalosporin-C deacetylase-like acetyl esterase
MLTFAPHLDGYHDVADQMIHHLRTRAESLFRAREQRKQGITTVAAFEEYRAQFLQHYREAIGGFPVPDGQPRPPLQAEIRGTLDRGSFTIQKLLYQSLPEFYVTAALYVPKGLTGPAPAVLFVCGHHEAAKAAPEYQAICAELAQNGFVVLAMDPPGQGERRQYWDPETGRRIVGGCTTEHTHAGLPVMLQGASVSRWFTWDAMRAVDYLCSRPEVDGARLGVTGNSGGGTQSILLMLAEPRLAAAVPCTFVMTLESYHATGQPQDSEQYLAGCFTHGPDHDDYLTAMAPKPVLVGAAAYDFFPLEGSLEAVRRAKEVYQLYGAEDRVEIAIAPTRHEYGPQLREAAVNWFRQHLAGLPPDFRAGTPEILPEEALHVTPTGQVLDAFPRSKTLFDLGRELLEERPPNPSRDPEALRRAAAAALGIAGTSREAPIYPRIIQETVVDGYPVEKLFFFSEPGICVAGVMVHPRGAAPAERTEILLLENGTASIPEERSRIEGLLRRGRRVLVFDPRGIGAVESRPFGGRPPHDREWRLGCDAMMMETSTLGLRVYDVLRAFDYLRTCREDVDPGTISLHGAGSGAAWAWYAAVLEPRFSALAVEEMLSSYRDLVETRLYDSHRCGMKNLAYGLLRHFDLPDLFPALAPRPVRILTPRDACGEPLSPARYRESVLARNEGCLPDGWAPDLE